MNEVQRIRRAAGCSQADLAVRSGVAQPNIAAYESGRRRPSAQMIERLRAAARPRPSEAIAAHRDDVLRVLAQHRMAAPRLFGSAVRGQDGPGSDLDLLVDMAADGDVLDLIDAGEALEELLGVPVDLVTSRSIGPEHEISRTAIPL